MKVTFFFFKSKETNYENLSQIMSNVCLINLWPPSCQDIQYSERTFCKIIANQGVKQTWLHENVYVRRS